MSKYKIPVWLWLLVGIVIAVFSKYVSTKAGVNKASMALFFYIGLLFVAIGIFKILTNIIFKKGSSEKKDKKSPDKSKHDVVHCKNCGAKNYAFFNYCHKCGKKLV